jgi:hypothetical protein
VEAFPSPNGTSGRNSKPGFIKVNQVIVHTWNKAPICCTVRLNHKCDVIEIIEYSNSKSSKWKTISAYMHTLSNQSIIIGVCYGNSQQTLGLLEFGIQQRYINKLNVRGIISFLGWVGYPGHTRKRITTKRRSVNKLSSNLYLGEYQNELISHHCLK